MRAGHVLEVIINGAWKIAQEDRRRVNVVDGDVEEALDLIGMQIHHHHAVDSDGRQEIGDDLRRDRHTCGARTPVLPRVAEIRNDGSDPRGG